MTIAMPSRLDSDLQGTSAAHLVQCLLVVFELEDVSHLICELQDQVCELREGTYHSLGLDLSALEVFDGSWEAVGLRERPNDLSKG